MDTSVAAKWVVQEAGSEQALALLDRDEPLVAPDRMIPELVSVLRRKCKAGQISEAQFLKGIEEALGALDRIVPSSEVAFDAALLSLEFDHSPYDCFFLATALGRGVFVTADNVFERKCIDRGYGKLVVSLADIGRGRLDALLAFESVEQEALGSIRRLTPLLKKTFDVLQEEARRHQDGRFAFLASEDLAAGFSSPAYRSLEMTISKLPSEQRAFLLALGWLGRGYYSGSDWPHLLANAKAGSLPDDFKQHRSYIMAQMNAVPDGLAKLRAHYGIQE
ncbi:PIN domain-containing protein [Bosea vaviloviae]|uniref:PIN domain-containing protein n=1 Tax=Bosea vaviloviae TaxID=1526658 RepID=UPI001FCCDC77|nr:PIN domain-containing protein [Bosea vaviloviae]